MKRVLFVLKEAQNYGPETFSYGQYASSGLYWSTQFVVDMLVEHGIEAKLVTVFDNSFIDHEIQKFNPDVVVIEALWVVPEKFIELQRLRPNVEFIVALHSNMPFLSQEPIAIDWIKRYVENGVAIAVNTREMERDVIAVLTSASLFPEVLYLPDYFPINEFKPREHHKSDVLKVACLGALRPLKNQLIQAVAAMEFAEREDKILHFYINTAEQDGREIHKNIRDLFENTDHVLIEESWIDRHELLKLLARMDISMHVSFSETFCIIAADAIAVGTPIVVSDEVSWASFISKAKTTNSNDIVDTLELMYKIPSFAVKLNRVGLKHRSHEAKQYWLQFAEFGV